MKLNADILYHTLKQELKTVTLHGSGNAALLLERPVFYLERTQTFANNHVYVCSADHLPTQPVIEENVCLVCMGGHWILSAFYARCCVIQIDADTDIFRVFNLVQHIFDRYAAWSEQLQGIVRRSASLPALLEASREVFENPMLLNGADLRYLGVTEETYLQQTLGLRLDTETFDTEKLATFLSLHDMSTHIKEPLLLKLEGKQTLSVNLFDQDEYLGCLTIFGEFRPLRESDKALAQHLAGFLQQAIQRNPTLASTRSALRRALRCILSGQSIDFELRRILSRENEKTAYVCLRLQSRLGAISLPGSYLAASLENSHPGAMAMEYENAVAAFVPLQHDETELLSPLAPLFAQGSLICGISAAFRNLYDANHAWFQASAALENGSRSAPTASVFHFQEQILPQLLTAALAGRPAAVYYTDGMRRLKAHDETSSVSYLDTLRVYLENDRSVTRTAQALFLHRSTLLDRLEHITRLLGSDLKDPDLCLTLRILLRAQMQQKQLLCANR